MQRLNGSTQTHPRALAARFYIEVLMNASKVQQPAGADQRLRYALRAMGFAVVLFSTFFLMRSITLDPVMNGFFAVSAGLGFVILVAGWMPGHARVATRATSYRPASVVQRPAHVPAPVLQPVVKRVR